MNHKFYPLAQKPRSYHLYQALERGFKTGKLDPEVFSNFQLAADISVKLDDSESLTFILLFSQLKLQQEQGHSSLSFRSWLESEQQWNQLNQIAQLYYRFLQYWHKLSLEYFEQRLNNLADKAANEAELARLKRSLERKSHRLHAIKDDPLESRLQWQFQLEVEQYAELFTECFADLINLEITDFNEIYNAIHEFASLTELREEATPESLQELADAKRKLDYALVIVLISVCGELTPDLRDLLLSKYQQGIALADVTELNPLVSAIINKYDLEQGYSINDLLPFALLLLDLWQKLYPSHNSTIEKNLANNSVSLDNTPKPEIDTEFPIVQESREAVQDYLDNLAHPNRKTQAASFFAQDIAAEQETSIKRTPTYLQAKQLEQSYQQLVQFWLPNLEDYFSQASLLAWLQTAFFELGSQDLQINSAAIATPEFLLYLQQETLSELISRLQTQAYNPAPLTKQQKSPPLFYLTFNEQLEVKPESISAEMKVLQAKFPRGDLATASLSLNAAYRKETRLWFNFLQRIKNEIQRLEDTEQGSQASTTRFWYEFIQDYQFYKIKRHDQVSPELTEQQVAIVNSIGRNLSVIIGGPGTGKTTTVFSILVINTILKLIAQPAQLVRISLVAPTGKASEHLYSSIVSKAKELKQYLAFFSQQRGEQPADLKPEKQSLFAQLFSRLNAEQAKLLELALNQIIHAKGQTIHSNFKVNTTRPTEYGYVGKNKHPSDIIIIDEVGMINLNIFDTILQSLAPNTQLICLGDKDQLPAIGIGYFLGNISAQQLAYSQVGHRLLSEYDMAAYGQAENHSATEIKAEAAQTLYRYNPAQERLCFGDFIHQLVRSYRYHSRNYIGEYAKLVNNPQADLSKESLEIFARQEAVLNNTDPESKDQQIYLSCYQAYDFAQQLGELSKDKTYPRQQYLQLLSEFANLQLDKKLVKFFKQMSRAETHLFATSNPEDKFTSEQKEQLRAISEIWQNFTKSLQPETEVSASLAEPESSTSEHSPTASASSKKAQLELAWSEQLELLASFGLEQYLPTEMISTGKTAENTALLALPWLLRQSQQTAKKKVGDQLAKHSQELVLKAAQTAFARLKELVSELTMQKLSPQQQQEKLEAVFKVLKDTKFLCPMRQGKLGVEELNRQLKESFTKRQGEYGYPILVTQNQSDLNLVNGDIGIILKNAQGERCYFNKKSASGDFLAVAPSQINEFEEAFFTTIHKSQGDEFENTHVVLPLEINKFISRAMYYTGITRVKKNLYIYAPVQFFLKASLPEDKRNTNLEFDWQAMLTNFKAN